MIPVVFFYILACLPFVYGGIMYALNKRIHIAEWLGNAALCFVLAGIFHYVGIFGLTADVETWSGQLTNARHYTAWQEYYEEAIYRTEHYTETESYRDSEGNYRTRTVHKTRRVFSHWEPRKRWHNEHWRTDSNINTSYSVDSAFFEYLCAKFRDKRAVPGDRRTSEHNSRMIAGNPNDYVTQNLSGWVEPITKLVSFENRVKATPSVFSFPVVPPDMKGLYEYPRNDNPFISDRLIGSAPATIDQFVFDQMNARLGPKKFVNVIMVGMGDVDSMKAEWQRAKWIGGKKNDIVICWGGLNKSPTWVKVFGWSDSDVCKRNLESIVLDNGATTATLPLIEEEIKARYVLKDWEKSFAHISIPARISTLWWYLGFMVFTQVGLWAFFHKNEINKI